MRQVPKDTWDDHIPSLMLAYRSSVPESTNFTPHHMMFGQKIQLPTDLMCGGGAASGETLSEYVAHLRKHLEVAYRTAWENLRRGQKCQKEQYDRKATGGRYTEGNLVWLYFPAVPKGRSRKLHWPWKGPYRVVKVISDVIYWIRLVSASERGQPNRRHRPHLVVHFNQLKPCHLQKTAEDVMVPLPKVQSQLAFQVRKISWKM